VIGIVPGVSVRKRTRTAPTWWRARIGYARNLSVVAGGDAVIAIGGEWGTLSEIGHARTFGKTVIALRSWGLTGRERMEGAPGVIPAETPKQAVAAALDPLIRRRRAGS
jgi:predicted Rossmann-fold nucleotide-binding protein